MSNMSKPKYMDPSLSLEERVSDLVSQMTLDEKVCFLQTRHPAIERLGIKEFKVGGEGAHGLLVRGPLDQRPYGNSTVFPQPFGFSCTWDVDLMKRVGAVIGDEARIWNEKDNRTQWLTPWFPTIDMERDPRWGRTEEAYGEDPFLVGKLSVALIKGFQGEDPFYLKAASAPKHFYGNNVEANRASASTNIGERVKREYYLRVFKYAFTEGRAASLMTAYNEINGIPCIVNPEVLNIVKGEWGCEGFIVCDGGDLPQTVTHHKYCETNAEAVALSMKAGIDCFVDMDAERIIGAAKEALSKGLMDESDVDRAVTNIFKVRFRFGQFDPDEMCPFNNMPQERLCGKEHSDVALEASHKAVVMLQNDGILPLDPAKCGKVLVLGDLAEENLADWYSGSPVETNAPLESIKNIVGEETVSIVGTHDHCAIFNEEENGWLCVDKDGKVSYDSNEDSRAIFEEIDWGYNSVSYRNVDSKKYLNITRERELGCTGDDVWGWFTHELFLRDIDTGAFLPHGHLYGDRYNSEQKDELGVRISKLRREILTDGMAPAIDAAVNADTILVVLGNHTLINGRECFDRPSIAFPPRWTKLLERLAAVNKNVVLTIIAGYPFGFAEQSKFVRAVLYTTHGEQYVGRAVADTLFGRNNPAGRLSMTWYLSDDDLPDINDYDIINSPRTYMYFDKPVQYPFGYGLSYTSFEYKDISAKQSEETSTENCGGGGYTISCVVRNCGDRDGDEVVQLYATFNGVSVKAPIKQLCGFKRINLAPDEKVTVEFFVPAEELRLFDEKANAFSIIPESIVFAIGASSADIRLTVTL